MNTCIYYTLIPKEFISYLNTGLITHLIWPNDARPINSRMQVSANCGGSDRSSVGLSGVVSSLSAYLRIQTRQRACFVTLFLLNYLEFCMLYSNDGTILSICTGSQIFSTKSSERVFLTTPYKDTFEYTDASFNVNNNPIYNIQQCVIPAVLEFQQA